jgi:AcrR family transcriptional regulator
MTMSTIPASHRSRARGSYKKSEVSRRQVLEAAVQALAARGYARTSVSDIAQAAGMSKGAVHYHFDSKDDLIAKVLEHCVSVSRDRVRAVWDAPGAPREKIRRVIHEMRAVRRQGTAELRVMADLAAQAIHDERLRALLGSMHEANRKDFVEYLTQSLETMGSVRLRIPPRVLARLLFGVVDGLAMHDFFDPAGPGDDDAIEQALDSIGLTLFQLEST